MIQDKTTYIARSYWRSGFMHLNRAISLCLRIFRTDNIKNESDEKDFIYVDLKKKSLVKDGKRIEGKDILKYKLIFLGDDKNMETNLNTLHDKEKKSLSENQSSEKTIVFLDKK